MGYNDYVSPNRYTWSQRQIQVLNEEIDDRLEELEEMKGFFKRFRAKRKIEKLKEERSKHGESLMAYEYQKENGIY